MKISNRDKKIIIVVIGSVAVLLSYFLVFKSMSDKNKALMSENLQLTARIADLQTKKANEAQYVSETERLNQEVADILTDYPSYLQIENGIMDVVGLEERTDADVPAVTIADPVSVAVSTASAAAASDTADTAAAETAEGQVEASVASQYYLYDVNTNLSYSATYDGMKDLLNEITQEQDKKSISTFTATLDLTSGEISGALSYESYFIFGQDKDYVPADIPNIKHGTKDIFGSTGVKSATKKSAQSAEASEDTSEEESSEQSEE
jgi:uncharacterized protein YsxB (DUF464 family)